jgi:hypothetical protein
MTERLLAQGYDKLKLIVNPPLAVRDAVFIDTLVRPVCGRSSDRSVVGDSKRYIVVTVFTAVIIVRTPVHIRRSRTAICARSINIADIELLIVRVPNSELDARGLSRGGRKVFSGDRRISRCSQRGRIGITVGCIDDVPITGFELRDLVITQAQEVARLEVVMTDVKFPSYLLNASTDERLAYFKNLTIAHPKLRNAFDALWYAVRNSKPESVILLYGPTGVGKTTLIDNLKKKIVEQFFKALERDKQLIPYVSVEAEMPPFGNFEWGSLFRDILLQLSEPRDPNSIRLKVDDKEPDFQELLRITRNRSVSTIRFAVENGLRIRKPLAVLVDEAQHLTVLASARKLLDQQNTIKSVANRAQTRHILAGHYDIMPLRNLNGQLARRSLDIHFSRYDIRLAAEATQFRNVCWTFQNHIPLLKTPDLVSHWEYLYERSIGCVGILKDWILSAYSIALQNNVPHLDIDHLRQTALPIVKCQAIANEIFAAEDELADEDTGSESLRTFLTSPKDSITNDDLLPKVPTSPAQKPIQKKKGPIARKPSRDPIGRNGFEDI